MPLKGNRVSASLLKHRLERVNQWFTDNNYVCSKLVVAQAPGVFMNTLTLYSIEPRLINIKLVAVDKDGKPEEGTRIKTRLQTIYNALRLQQGQIFRWNPDGFGSLMALGIFEYADAEVNAIANHRVELVLYLRERSTGRIEPGAGMSSDGRVFGDLSISDNNFMGRAQRLRVAWQKRLDEGRSSGGILFEDMRIGANFPLSYKVKAYRDSTSKRAIPTNRLSTQQNDRPALHDDDLFYEKDRDGVMLDLGYRPNHSYMMFNLTPMYEIIHPNLVHSSSGLTTSQVVLQTAYTHATRLPVELPRAGHFARIEHSLGSVLRRSTRPFYKAVVSVSQYFGIKRFASVAVAGACGFGSENLPWHEQKSLGGHRNVRGYSYGELGTHKSYGTARVEMRIPLTHLEDAVGPRKSVDDDKERERTTSDTERDNGKKRTKRSAAKQRSGRGKRQESSDNEQQKTDFEDDKPEEKTTPLSVFQNKLPPLVGVLFGDVAMSTSSNRGLLGASYGIGIRIAGVVTVDWTRTFEEGESRLRVGLVDRSW
ncbi:hypothetical protein BWQ96_03562 [Gracilariopsis chorda]|uniref:Bacterial surface antigen (D15) domain-containing protein n=1 Tax=Gracilariopsis chorda TaxID=448386 RepID=A0A2V3IX53_9FLOR|nr:hypothetical protein BWQ96_03562 [Gracilariopsis chorda]|eukprot:PXF46736.1 hypothetical protein BWQ96_03562 [Gracilariopsis chorda]